MTRRLLTDCERRHLQALRSTGLLLAVTAVIVLLGGLVQINPIWQWGHYEPALSTNGAQPDWYLGCGALRLMPPLEIHFLGKTWGPNPFFEGALFPAVVFAVLYAWPWSEPRLTGDRQRHDLLERPRDRPNRTALGAAFFTWVANIFTAGSADRLLVRVAFPYEDQVWFFRIAAFVLPVIVFVATRRVCRELRDTGARPLRGWTGTVVHRSAGGGYVPADQSGASDSQAHSSGGTGVGSASRSGSDP